MAVESSQSNSTSDQSESQQSRSSDAAQVAPNTQSFTQIRNAVIALVAVVLSTALFFGLRSQTQVPSLDRLVAATVPYETALANQKPTLVEFYANWCTSCQAMAPMLADLEAKYSDRLNFVMLNVDNDKWLPELLAYNVNGIPEFVFLDAQGETQAIAIGEQPESVMAANLDALIEQQPIEGIDQPGKTSSVTDPGTLSSDQTKSSAKQKADPRSHGAQVVSQY